MAYSNLILEEQLKNEVRVDYFGKYSAGDILGKIDFAVAVPNDTAQAQLFDTEYFLWAECKRGTSHNIYHSLVQLIITIGKARTFDKFLPPPFLGAFDAEKIAFIPYEKMSHIFYQNDFNWNVTPSDHETKEFKQVLALVEEIINKEMLLFHYDKDDKELRRFIQKNFVIGANKVAKIHITKTNFISIYQRWAEEVKPTIAVNWDAAKRNNILSADFYLADILSAENQTLKDKLRVILRGTQYEMDKKQDEMGLWASKSVSFNDKQVAHTQFWNRYHRPPKEDYWDYIVERRDLLVPQDVRERKGSYFTPQKWVALSQEYLAAELGEDWQDEYYIWDCCAGTGNLLNGLSNKYNIWASTLDEADVNVMKERIANGANLLDSHVFQFDFLNDDFSKLPKGLQDIINNEEKRKKLVVYINPPYAEAGSATTTKGTGSNKTGVATTTQVRETYKKQYGLGIRELYAQFFIRINHEIPSCTLAEFSTLKILQGSAFSDFRQHFKATLKRLFVVPANTFDNVKGAFPIGFFIWDTSIEEPFTQIEAHVYDEDNNRLANKIIAITDNKIKITKWITKYLQNNKSEAIGFTGNTGPDYQHNAYLYIASKQVVLPSGSTNNETKYAITHESLIPIRIYFAARLCIDASWLNDRDQFLYPNDGWKIDKEFQADCLAFTLLHGQNRITANEGVNHWIPFREYEVNAQEKFDSNFMADFIAGKMNPDRRGTASSLQAEQTTMFEEDTNASILDGTEAIVWSAEAQAVMDAGRELWKYYHAQFGTTPQGNNPLPAYGANAAFYDIRLHFQGTKTTASGKVQMNTKSEDVHYTELISDLRAKLRILADKIAEKVYLYGFLK